jgi:tetratricopeptide (TPR) repeat protein
MDKDNHYLELDKLFFRADNDIKDGLIVEAYDTLTYIIEQDTEYGKAYNHLGWIYETKYKDFSKAEECYKLALKYSPEYHAIYINYAILLSTIERFDDLTMLLEKAMQVQGINKSKIWNEYGIMYELQGNYDQAIEAYRASIRCCLINEDIERYEDSIARCNKKKDTFGTVN